jgi:hypothetical protein
MTHPTNPDGEVTVTNDQIATLTRLAMILEAGQAENGIDLARQATYAEALRALLSATQPAAVDREAVSVQVYMHRKDDKWLLAGEAPEGTELRPGINVLYAAPLDKDASKPAAPYSAPFTTDVPQCCGEPSTCDDPCQHNAAPSVEPDERGAFQAIHEFLGIAIKRLYPTPDKPNSDWAKLRAAVDALAVLEARAASTSANVAQGAEALYEAMATDDDENHPNLWMEVDLRAFEVMKKRPDVRTRIVYASPPAQTALTDDARDALGLAALLASAVINYPDFDDGDPESAKPMLHIARRLDAALTAAQSASGDAK